MIPPHLSPHSLPKTADLDGTLPLCELELFSRNCRPFVLTGLKGFAAVLTTTGSGEDYFGDGFNTTQNGVACKSWAQLHAGSEAGLGDHQFCRNPRGSRSQPGCYSSADGRWANCRVPICSEPDEDTVLAIMCPADTDGAGVDAAFLQWRRDGGSCLSEPLITGAELCPVGQYESLSYILCLRSDLFNLFTKATIVWIYMIKEVSRVAPNLMFSKFLGPHVIAKSISSDDQLSHASHPH